MTLEQVTYFEPPEPADFAQGRLPLWIWMDDPSYYGFPSYGEPTVKAAQDCGGPIVDPDRRGSETDHGDAGTARRAHARGSSRAAGAPVRSLRCQYTLTPDRDFVISPVPGHESVVVGMGAAHGVQVRADVRPAARRPRGRGAHVDRPTPFRMDRPALTDPDYQAHWLV